MRLSDDEIMAEAIRMVECGVSVALPVNGRSMLPFVVGGRESLVLEKPQDLKVGDVVLAFVDGRRYVIHRIVRLDGESVTLMGDGNLGFCEYCKVTDVRALATYVVGETGRKRNLYSPARKLASKLWNLMLPVRRYLLKIYLITHRI